jgi:hypothetical protein
MCCLHLCVPPSPWHARWCKDVAARPMPVPPAVRCPGPRRSPRSSLPCALQGWRGWGTPCATPPYKQAVAQGVPQCAGGEQRCEAEESPSTLPYVIPNAARDAWAMAGRGRRSRRRLPRYSIQCAEASRLSRLVALTVPVFTTPDSQRLTAGGGGDRGGSDDRGGYGGRGDRGGGDDRGGYGGRGVFRAPAAGQGGRAPLSQRIRRSSHDQVLLLHGNTRPAMPCSPALAACCPLH